MARPARRRRPPLAGSPAVDSKLVCPRRMSCRKACPAMTTLGLRSCLNPRMALSLDLRWLWSATGTVAALARLAWSAAGISADLAAGGGDHEPGGAEGVNTL